jgi:flagellar protein FliS
LTTYATAHAAYTESAVLTAPPERLVLMLYDGAIRFLRQGAAALSQGDRTTGRERIRKAEAIIDELNITLDMSQGDIAEKLRSIYLFCKRHLMESSLKDDAAGVEAVIRLLAELRESWAAIAVQQATQTAA